MIIKTIAIVGAGNLGTRIGLQAALAGFQVRFYDVSETALGSSRKLAQKLGQYLVKSNQATDEAVEKAFTQVFYTVDLRVALSDCDLVSESVTEDLTIKEKVWQQIDLLAPATGILTTNTSFLLPSQLASSISRPAKFCAFHFHDVFYSRVVDVMPHAGTDPAILDILVDVGKKLNQVPIVVKKESPGYVFNFMLMALIGAAGKLKTGDIASIEDIDRSWMVNFHMPTGPFGILDNIGLDTAWHVVKQRTDAASQAFASVLKSYIDAGKLGEKSGEGFYRYPNPAYRQPEFLL